MHTSGAPSTEIALPSAGNNICFWALEQVPSVWQQWWAGVQHGRQQEGKKKRKKKNCFRSLHLYYVYWIWFKRSWHQRFAQKFIMWEARAYFIVHPGKGLAETTLNWEGFFFFCLPSTCEKAGAWWCIRNSDKKKEQLKPQQLFVPTLPSFHSLRRTSGSSGEQDLGS